MQLGFPLSRLVHADPKGRNAGWTTYLYYGFDEALPRDARRFAPVRGRSDLFSGNIQYKLNSWVTFAFEQGYYRTRAANRSALDFGGFLCFAEFPATRATMCGRNSQRYSRSKVCRGDTPWPPLFWQRGVPTE